MTSPMRTTNRMAAMTMPGSKAQKPGCIRGGAAVLRRIKSPNLKGEGWYVYFKNWV